jgi:hypothetical protein
LNLTRDEALSNFAFNFNLRRYTWEGGLLYVAEREGGVDGRVVHKMDHLVGWCRLTL